MKRCSGLNQERNLQRLQDKTDSDERQQQKHFLTGGSFIIDYGLNVFQLKMS